MITDQEFKQVMEYTRDELLKQMFLMSHENGYPSMAIPKATVLELPQLLDRKGYQEWCNTGRYPDMKLMRDQSTVKVITHINWNQNGHIRE